MLLWILSLAHPGVIRDTFLARVTAEDISLFSPLMDGSRKYCAPTNYANKITHSGIHCRVWRHPMRILGNYAERERIIPSATLSITVMRSLRMHGHTPPPRSKAVPRLESHQRHSAQTEVLRQLDAIPSGRRSTV